MARLIQCPRCRIQLDVASVSGGATVRCSECKALVRVPTAAYVAVEPEPATAPAPRASGRQTPVFRKMAHARMPGSGHHPAPRIPVQSRGNNTVLIVGGVVAGLVLIGILIALVVTQQQKKDKEKKAPPVVQVPSRTQETDSTQQQDPLPQEQKKPIRMHKAYGPGGDYVPPATFERGAENHARKNTNVFPEVKVESTLLSSFDELAKKGDVAALVKEDYKWMACIVHRLLSDEETIVRSAFQALHDICDKWQISSSDSGFKNPVRMDLLNSYEYRGGDYLFWGEWWQKNSRIVDSWREGKAAPIEFAPIDPDKANWDKILQDIRGGGAFEDTARPEGMAAARIKAMGRPGIVKLIGLLDHEELTMVRAIVAALNYLTGEQKPIPSAATKGQAKTEWETWLKSH